MNYLPHTMHTHYCCSNLFNTNANVADMYRTWNAVGDRSYACILFKVIILLKTRIHSIQHNGFRLPCWNFNFYSLKLFQLRFLKFLPLFFKCLQFCCTFVKP